MVVWQSGFRSISSVGQWWHAYFMASHPGAQLVLEKRRARVASNTGASDAGKCVSSNYECYEATNATVVATLAGWALLDAADAAGSGFWTDFSTCDNHGSIDVVGPDSSPRQSKASLPCLLSLA